MTGKSSILIVDDDIDFLGIVERILRAKGFEVETTPSASEAISRAKKSFYNVTILDISLPDIEGTELLSILMQMHPDMIAIMLTGYSSAQNAMQSLNRGAFAFLEKPLSPDHLLSEIGRGLEKQRLVLLNRRLMGELEQRNRETNILLGVSQSVSQSLDLEQIIYPALRRVAESIDIDAGYVHLFENGHLLFQGHYGLSSPLAEEIRAMELDQGITGAVVQQDKPIISTTADRTEPVLSVLAKEEYLSFACIPLTIVGESIGTISIATKTEHHFTAREIKLLIAIGREIAIAVRNAQLYEEASSAKSLRDLDALRTRFLANVSHELRTPLTVIKGSANSLLQPDVNFDEETWREFLQSIDKDADRLTNLVDDLLIMSRIESGVLEMKPEARDLSEVVESIRDRLDNLASRHKFRVDLPTDLPRVMIDEYRIGEVLTNLVENSVKYSDEGTQISLNASPNGRDVIISISDEGIGIPAELHEKVFDRFYQAENRRGQGTGTGLGLSICHGIVEAHGGRIWMESEPGRGAKFSFSIPKSG